MTFGVNMKPTRAHYFFAQNWPTRIWIVSVPSLFVVLMARALGPVPEMAGFEAEARNYLFLLGIALLLGFCMVALTGPFILGPLYHYRAELNGAPFQMGDRVEVLVGANRGQVARVAEVWEWRGDLRVEWSSSVARKGRTIFHCAQVIKVRDAEPPVSADAPQAARR
jgi:hypothetical protein